MMPRAPRDLARLGLLSSVGLILFVVENLAPRPLPWMKLGLGNLAVLVALIAYGGAAALFVSAVKVVVGGLLSGGLGSPAFVIGAGAGLASVLAMALVHRRAAALFSPIGVSIVGALAHQLAQLALAYLYIRQAALFGLVPLFLLSGVVSGTLIGLLAHWAMEKLRANGWPEFR